MSASFKRLRKTNPVPQGGNDNRRVPGRCHGVRSPRSNEAESWMIFGHRVLREQLGAYGQGGIGVTRQTSVPKWFQRPHCPLTPAPERELPFRIYLRARILGPQNVMAAVLNDFPPQLEEQRTFVRAF